MATASIPLVHRGRADVARALTGGVVVGVLDGAFAMALCLSVNPACRAERMFQGIAAGLLGGAAFEGGAATAALGAALHFAIATAWSALFVIAVRHWPPLARARESRYGAFKVGPAFGVTVWAFMRFVVIPLSHARAGAVLSWVTVVMILGHVLFVGLPIALIAGARGGRGANPSPPPLASIRRGRA